MIFSTVPFALIPFADNNRSSLVNFSAEFFADANFDVVIYVSTAAGFATKPTDALPSQPFRGVFQSYDFARSILGSDIGSFIPGNGTLVINNSDAFYDFLARDYTIDASQIVIRATGPDDSYDDAFVIANVTATDWVIDTASVSIPLRDHGYRLDVPMQPNIYLGTGGKEGGADLANKTKPLGLGSPREISPPLVSPSLLIYQVNDGSVQAITAVYDRGVALGFISDYATYDLLAAADLSAVDGYATCIAEGYFRLADLGELITCDIEGDNRDGYVETSADIVRWAIRNRTDLVDPDDLVTSRFEAVNTFRPAPIEYWIGPDDNLTVADFIANIMNAILGWGGHNREGLYELRLFEAPAGTPVASFSRKDIIGDDVVREPLPSSYRPPPWRWHITYARAFTVQTDVTTAVTAERKAFLAEQYRLGGAENAAIKVDHPFATDPEPVQAYFRDKADADDEGERRITLFKTTRALYRFSIDRRGLNLSLGDVIELTHERFDLSLGKLMMVLQLTEKIAFDTEVETVEIVAYG